MRKIVIDRIVAAFLVVLLFASTVVPALAVGFDLTPDAASVQLWNSAVNTPSNVALNVFASYFGCPATVQDVFWNLMDNAVSKTGEQSLDYMNDLVGRYNDAFTGQYQTNMFSTIAKNSKVLCYQSIATQFFQSVHFDFELATAPGSGLLRIREKIVVAGS